MKNISKGTLATLVILILILTDQVVKIWIKTHFYLGEDYPVTSWFKIDFIENNGMAFGMEMGSKLFLTLFRIVAVGLLIWYLSIICRKKEFSKAYVVCVSLVLAGAAGNIFDCVFYGVIFNNPMPPEVAVMFPPGGGYAPLFHGRVVDMLYFPLFSFNWPQWIPFIGGDHFLFFQPVFNIADSAITVGMLVIIIFMSKYLSIPLRTQESVNDSSDSKEDNSDHSK